MEMIRNWYTLGPRNANTHIFTKTPIIDVPGFVLGVGN